jgi:hypothetical protein
LRCFRSPALPAMRNKGAAALTAVQLTRRSSSTTPSRVNGTHTTNRQGAVTAVNVLGALKLEVSKVQYRGTKNETRYRQIFRYTEILDPLESCNTCICVFEIFATNRFDYKQRKFNGQQGQGWGKRRKSWNLELESEAGCLPAPRQRPHLARNAQATKQFTRECACLIMWLPSVLRSINAPQLEE